MLPIKSGGEVLYSDPFQKACNFIELVQRSYNQTNNRSCCFDKSSVTYVQFRL